MQCFFGDDFHPELADIPLKGEYMQAFIDWHRNKQNRSNAPDLAAMAERSRQIIANNFVDMCNTPQAIEYGFSINDADRLLNQIIARPLDDVNAGMNDLFNSLDERDKIALSDAAESMMAPIMKMGMSACIAAQEGKEDLFLELFQRHVDNSSSQAIGYIKDFLEGIQSSELSEAQKINEIEGCKHSFIKSVTSGAIGRQNTLTSLTSQSPIYDIVKAMQEITREKNDEITASIYDLNLETKAGKIRLQQIQDQMKAELAEEGVQLIDRPKS